MIALSCVREVDLRGGHSHCYSAHDTLTLCCGAYAAVDQARMMEDQMSGGAAGNPMQPQDMQKLYRCVSHIDLWICGSIDRM